MSDYSDYISDYLDVLNSATKYPSIDTYHSLDPRNGRLADGEPVQFPGQVILTEKIDGTNARVIVMPDRDWFIGSREELLYARGDRIGNNALGIVDALKPFAERLALYPNTDGPYICFGELYGGGIGQGWKQYAAAKNTAGFRIFDVALVPAEVLEWPREQVSSWRQHGGQRYLAESDLVAYAQTVKIPTVPRIAAVPAAELPQGLDGTLEFLTRFAPTTRAALRDAQRPGRAEGIVLRSADRTVIAKARFQDYERTLRARA